MNEFRVLVLKGRCILAQDKRRRSAALGGYSSDRKIVRAITSIKEKVLFRTKQGTSCFPKMMYCNSVRNNDIAQINIFARTISLLYPITRVAFQAGKIYCSGLVYKEQLPKERSESSQTSA